MDGVKIYDVYVWIWLIQVLILLDYNDEIMFVWKLDCVYFSSWMICILDMFLCY